MAAAPNRPAAKAGLGQYLSKATMPGLTNVVPTPYKPPQICKYVASRNVMNSDKAFRYITLI